MSCEQEMCPYWDGHGCPCAVLDITPEERNRAQEALDAQVDVADSGTIFPEL